MFVVPQLLESFNQIFIGLYGMSRLEMWMCNSCGCPVCTIIPKQIKQVLNYEVASLTKISLWQVISESHRYHAACFSALFSVSTVTRFQSQSMNKLALVTSLQDLLFRLAMRGNGSIHGLEQVNCKLAPKTTLPCHHLMACGRLNFSNAEYWRCCWFPRWVCYRCALLVLYDLVCL